MFRDKTIIIIYLLVAVSFTNISNLTVNMLGVPALPILFALAIVILFYRILRTKSYPMTNYLSANTYIINFFWLIFLSFGLFNADLGKALRDEVYLLLAAFFTCHLVLLYVQSREELEGVMLTAVLCAPVIALHGGYDFFVQLTTGSTWDETRACGWWIDPNTYAIVLVIIYLLSFYFIKKQELHFRWAGYIAQFSAAAGVFLSLSRGGIILFILITVLNYRVFFRRKLYLATIVTIMLSIYIVCSSHVISFKYFDDINISRLMITSEENKDDYSNGRSSAAGSGLMIYARHPLAGAGFGNIPDEAYAIDYIKIHTHNMFIEILALSGGIPLLAYLFMLWFLFQGVPKNGVLGKDLGPTLRQFIILIFSAGVFSHYLVLMKPVWIMLSLYPIYHQLSEVKA